MRTPIFRYFTGLVAAVGCLLSAQAQINTYELTPAWILTNSPENEWVSTNNTLRGLAYNPKTTHLLAVSRYPATNAQVYVLDSTNGVWTGNLSTNGIFTEINFPLNLVGVADDGVIFGCSLTTDSTNVAVGNTGPFRIYRWQDEIADPVVAYLGDPSNSDTNINHRRFGDSMAVRGSGTNTQIILGCRQGKVVTHFTTTDGTNFVAKKITAPDLLGANVMVTIAFGTNNTFWVKCEGGQNTNFPVQHFEYPLPFEPVDTAARLIHTFTNSTVVGGPLAFDNSSGLLATVGTKTHQTYLYRLAGATFVPQGASHPFPTSITNGNFTGALVFGDGKLFALDSNNGLMAFTIATNVLTSFTATISKDAGETSLTWPSITGVVYQPQFKTALSDPMWADLGAATNGTGTTISVSDSLESETKFYRVKAE